MNERDGRRVLQPGDEGFEPGFRTTVDASGHSRVRTRIVDEGLRRDQRTYFKSFGMARIQLLAQMATAALGNTAMCDYADAKANAEVAANAALLALELLEKGCQ